MTAITLTTAQKAVYQTRLDAAEEAWHALQMGQQARVYVDQNGERVEFNSSNSMRLRAYIIELRSALGLANGISGPMNAWML